MDIEKLIERLKCPQIHSCPMDDQYPTCNACQKSVIQDAATALSTLQAENAKLRAELSRKEELVRRQAKELERRDKLLKEQEAELEWVKWKRDSYKFYFDDLSSKPNCNTCKDKNCKYKPRIGDTVRANCPLWRGPEEGRKEE